MSRTAEASARADEIVARLGERLTLGGIGRDRLPRCRAARSGRPQRDPQRRGARREMSRVLAGLGPIEREIGCARVKRGRIAVGRSTSMARPAAVQARRRQLPTNNRSKRSRPCAARPDADGHACQAGATFTLPSPDPGFNETQAFHRRGPPVTGSSQDGTRAREQGTRWMRAPPYRTAKSRVHRLCRTAFACFAGLPFQARRFHAKDARDSPLPLRRKPSPAGIEAAIRWAAKLSTSLPPSRFEPLRLRVPRQAGRAPLAFAHRHDADPRRRDEPRRAGSSLPAAAGQARRHAADKPAVGPPGMRSGH